MPKPIPKQQKFYQKPLTLLISFIPEYLREVFKTGIEHLVVSTILHSSGNPDLLEDDIEITKRLAETSKTLGMEIIGHIIIP
ncbi:hypothetical protein J7J81_03055 [bacterium]|nr:hypothetical protein [bacterium]